MKLNQLFAIDKPKKITSNQVIQQIKHACKIKKIGHGGTLDPLATGVLIIGINKATKLLQAQLTANKTYFAEIEFGYQTTTYDAEGEIINKQENMEVNVNDITAICENWKLNGYEQQVPIYSAVKQGGKELYKLAREGQENIVTPLKFVKLISYKIIDFKQHKLTIEIEVSKGFYVRSFANDMGIKLNGFATLVELRRLKSGEFSIEQAYTVQDIIKIFNQSNVS